MSSISGFAGYVHPSGIVSVGSIPTKRKKERIELDDDGCILPETYGNLNHYNDAADRRAMAADNNIQNIRIYGNNDSTGLGGVVRLLQAREISTTEAILAYSELGLSTLPNSRIYQENSNHDVDSPYHRDGKKPIKRYGLNGISRRGAMSVKDAVAVQEKEYGRSNLAFCTITLPALSPVHLSVVCENWPEVNKRIIEEIGRELIRNDGINDIAYCVEIQEKRYLRYGQIAPHLHLVFPCYCQRTDENNREFAITAVWLRALVKRIIFNLIGVEVDTNAAVDIQKIKKSAVGYIGKYMSKGGKIIKKIKEDGRENELPRSWHGMTKTLRIKVKRAIIRLSSNSARNLFYNPDKLVKMGIITRYNDVVIERRFSNKNNDDISAQIKYGISAKLSPKLNWQKELLLSVLDICDGISDEVCEDVRQWISMIRTSDMCQDIVKMIVYMKEEILIRNIDDEITDSQTGEIFVDDRTYNLLSIV